jgi:hypothetical protein
MESWLGNKANTRATYAGLLELGLTPTPKSGIKHPRYLMWRAPSDRSALIYHGPDSIDIHKSALSEATLTAVANLPGALGRSRDVKFMTDTPEGAEQALSAVKRTLAG